MKKTLLILTLILLYSCTNDENSSNSNPSDILLKKVVTHNLGTTYETVFTYNGKKLLQEKSERQKIGFTYDGDKIVRIEYYYSPDTENHFWQYSDFEYFADGTLKKCRTTDVDYQVIRTLDFIYNSDNTVNVTSSISNSSDVYIGKFTFEGGEVKQYDFISGPTSQYSYIYHYDNKNHPLKNVIGFDKLTLYNRYYSDLHNGGFSTNLGSINNLVSYSYLSDPSTIHQENIIEYNSDNFPVNINKDDPNIADFLFYE